MKRLISLIILLSLCCSSVLMVPAMATSSWSTSKYDIYEQEVAETIGIGGTLYTYHYYYDTSGNRAIKITNNVDNQVDTLVYNKAMSVFKLNNIVVATIVDTLNARPMSLRASNSWELWDSGNQYITWVAGVTVATLAAIFATAIGTVGGAAVLVAMEYNTLAVLAAASIGGTVYWAYYKHNDYLTYFKTTWTFYPSTGQSYGPYTYYENY